MNQLIKFIFLFVFVIYCAVAQANPSSDLRNILMSYQTFQSDYTQSTYDGSNNLIQNASGRMMFMRPGKFRWETNQPVHQLIVSDGQTLWVYDIDLAQITQKPVNKHQAADPAMLLAGDVSSLLKHFSVTRTNGGWFLLRPHFTSGSAFRYAAVLFLNNQLTSIRVLDSMNQTSIFNFTNVQINPPLDPNIFQFVPPIGVQVIQS